MNTVDDDQSPIAPRHVDGPCEIGLLRPGPLLAILLPILDYLARGHREPFAVVSPERQVEHPVKRCQFDVDGFQIEAPQQLQAPGERHQDVPECLGNLASCQPPVEFSRHGLVLAPAARLDVYGPNSD